MARKFSDRLDLLTLELVGSQEPLDRFRNGWLRNRKHPVVKDRKQAGRFIYGLRLIPALISLIGLLVLIHDSFVCTFIYKR
jgi:hypothetical protein